MSQITTVTSVLKSTIISVDANADTTSSLTDVTNTSPARSSESTTMTGRMSAGTPHMDVQAGDDDSEMEITFLMSPSKNSYNIKATTFVTRPHIENCDVDANVKSP